MLSISAAESGDHDQVQPLWGDSGLGRTAPDQWAALAEGATSIILVAKDGGEFAGRPSRPTTAGEPAFTTSPWRLSSGSGASGMR